MEASPTVVGLTAVIVAVTEERPRVLIVRPPLVPGSTAVRPAPADELPDALPAGPFDPQQHPSLDLGLRNWVKEQTGLTLRYVEQLYTFGNRFRSPEELYGGPRLLTVAYLALTHEEPVAGSRQAQWRDCYGFLPWEDWRSGRPEVIDAEISPALTRWMQAAADPAQRLARQERASLCFNLNHHGRRDPVLALERYEILYEVGLVAEAVRDRAAQAAALSASAGPLAGEMATGAQLGTAMASDDRRMLATALSRLRGKLAYRPLVFELLPAEFTLFQLQHVVEALAGMRLHKQNFRRMVMHAALVEPTGRTEAQARGRPAELYRFRRDVMAARSIVGVGLTPARFAD